MAGIVPYLAVELRVRERGYALETCLASPARVNHSCYSTEVDDATMGQVQLGADLYKAVSRSLEGLTR